MFILLGVCWAPLICRFFSPSYSGNVGPLFLQRTFLSLSPLSFKVAIRLWVLCILGMLYYCPSFWHCFSFFFNVSFFSDNLQWSIIRFTDSSFCQINLFLSFSWELFISDIKFFQARNSIKFFFKNNFYLCIDILYLMTVIISFISLIMVPFRSLSIFIIAAFKSFSAKSNVFSPSETVSINLFPISGSHFPFLCYFSFFCCWYLDILYMF